MRDGPTVSVIVASRGRPDALALCLTGLGQVQYHPFEVIVVADAAGRAAASAHALAPRLKCVSCDVANLSLARNLGLVKAAGEVVAFIDDDAIPEPGWLGHLTAPFLDASVAASGGYVLGRNGISLQWGARAVDAEGWHRDLSVTGPEPVTFDPEPGWAVRTEGTNMAVRRDVIVSLGGFDQSYRYYLDDTDLNMRLAALGARVAVVPKARVFHMQAHSAQRGVARAPRSLFDIGRSTAAYLNRYAALDRYSAALADQRENQRNRALRHMVSGTLVPGDVQRLLRDFDEGAEEGRALTAFEGFAPSEANPEFHPLNQAAPTSRTVTISGWAWSSRRLFAKAADAVREGALVEIYRHTPTALYHRRRFVPPGVWVQTGGVYGRAKRQSPLIQVTTLHRRVVAEKKTGPLSSVICLAGQK